MGEKRNCVLSLIKYPAASQEPASKDWTISFHRAVMRLDSSVLSQRNLSRHWSTVIESEYHSWVFEEYEKDCIAKCHISEGLKSHAKVCMHFLCKLVSGDNVVLFQGKTKIMHCITCIIQCIVISLLAPVNLCFLSLYLLTVYDLVFFGILVFCNIFVTGFPVNFGLLSPGRARQR
jgi:hypothetical protein